MPVERFHHIRPFFPDSLRITPHVIRFERQLQLRAADWRIPALAALLALSAGFFVARVPWLAWLIAIVVVIFSLAAADYLPTVERGGTMLLLGGPMILGYGFANVGVSINKIPVAATELILIPLAAIALFDAATRPNYRTLIPLLLFALLVAMRLTVDYPKYGLFAIRDTNLALEAFVLLVGYRAVLRDGVDTWRRRLGLILSLVLAYGLLFPWRANLAAASPSVGLRHAVPLLGSMRGVNFAVMTAGLFFINYKKGWVRILTLGLVIGMIGVFQARSLYLLFPITTLLLGWATRKKLKVALQITCALLVGILMLSLLSSAAVGRRGPLSAEFLGAHAKTLLGEEGPASGTIRGRLKWMRGTLDQVTHSPATLLVGVGLGPDLSEGLRRGDGEIVRKPHNDYLEVFARTGIVGFSIFLWLLLSLIVPIAKKARSGSGQNERFCAWVLAACAVYLGVAAVQPLLSWPYGTVPLFLLLGMGLGAVKGQLVQEQAAVAADQPFEIRSLRPGEVISAAPAHASLAAVASVSDPPDDQAETADVLPIRSERKVSKKGTIGYSGWTVQVSAKRAGEIVEVTESSGFVQVVHGGEFITKFSTRRPKGYISIRKRRRRVA